MASVYATVTYKVQGSGEVKTIGYTSRPKTLLAMSILQEAQQQGKVTWANMRVERHAGPLRPWVAWQPKPIKQVEEQVMTDQGAEDEDEL